MAIASALQLHSCQQHESSLSRLDLTMQCCRRLKSNERWLSVRTTTIADRALNTWHFRRSSTTWSSSQEQKHRRCESPGLKRWAVTTFKKQYHFCNHFTGLQHAGLMLTSRYAHQTPSHVLIGIARLRFVVVDQLGAHL